MSDSLPPVRSRPRLRAVSAWRTTLVVALGSLGFLIAAQLQSQAPHAGYSTQERAPLVATALELQSQQEALKAAVLAERSRIGTLERVSEGSAAQVRALNAELEAARLAAGLVPLRGPGVVIRLEDAPEGATPLDGADRLVSARDLRAVVSALWLAGAEAIDVNGERIVPSSAFFEIGGSVLVNSAYLTRPYDVAAIGPPGLYARLLAEPAFTSFVAERSNVGGIRLRYAELDDLPVAAFAGSVALRAGRPATTPQPAATATPAGTP